MALAERQLGREPLGNRRMSHGGGLKSDYEGWVVGKYFPIPEDA